MINCLLIAQFFLTVETQIFYFSVQAGALMIVGLLVNKVALSPKLVKSLIRSISDLAREDAKELTDLQWFRLSVMALVNLVQV